MICTYLPYTLNFSRMRLILNFILAFASCTVFAQTKPLKYSLSFPKTSDHYVHVELTIEHWNDDSLVLKMPEWTPGYYQLMNFAQKVEGVKLMDPKGNPIPVERSGNSWRINNTKNKSITISYDVKADRKFVASSFVDTSHAYLTPAGIFMYANDKINMPVRVTIVPKKSSDRIATGLEALTDREFTAPDFDILYDCPILIGPLEELPSFTVKGIKHRFIGYKMESFDRQLFMNNLKKMVETASGLIGDIPYKEYTFIAIGPGRGGIEHLNNTTISFAGSELNSAEGMNRTMNFIAHEYYHHYNIKRIRPYELGPFDYTKANRTNLLWVSEGLSVYYEYLVVKRAGLATEQQLFSSLSGNIRAHETDPGRTYQSLTQSSYETWSDGPFGRQGEEGDRSISYYDKGPVVGLLLDITIRKASANKQSLDDVMRFLYYNYYKKLKRGFTDAEFQEACEKAAGKSLNEVFEYVYTAKEIDYDKYLHPAGLKLLRTMEDGKPNFQLARIGNMDSSQQEMLASLLN
jgi:predicted metalloprotease with PDZ domain